MTWLKIDKHGVEKIPIGADSAKGAVTRDRTITESHDLWEILRVFYLRFVGVVFAYLRSGIGSN